MAKFRNQLAQPLQLDGDWQIALASISFPSNINNVNSAEIVAYVSSGAELDASHNRTGQLRRIRKGINNSSVELLEDNFRIVQLKNFDYDFDYWFFSYWLQVGKCGQLFEQTSWRFSS